MRLALWAALAAWLLVLDDAPARAQEGEEPVAPYVQSDANAGATPIDDPAVLAAFNGRDGINRIVDRTVDLSLEDPQLGPIFQPFDMVRLRRTLKEQFCYLLGGGCTYTGRDMSASHADMGVQTRDFNLLVQHLRTAMREEGVSNRMQNRFLAVLAPMHRDVVQR
ncbi:MAG: group 1 truncated hemoglobin [Hyphomonadaceae bacterium JAD_PAG50586_4]|nr:MAG: group 1 truncated hemoglobin [Hyphomonadaceae bacterium JAD_PAG50586_4]